MCTGKAQLLALAQYLTDLGAGSKKVGFELLELHKNLKKYKDVPLK